MLPVQPNNDGNKKEDDFDLALKRIGQVVAGIALTLGGIYVLGKSLRILGGLILDVKYFVRAVKA
jgi:hypothetical protein